eukprot:TRINITY_DN3794_c0_g1_i1.p1 TRINITY_DN3794_c0_g1~~TRINITY_DN3794_c0_g1_i1.p1  ORF type:complete len:382 (-),score=152.06 TRINITY_DN3794_c0_g1_i1:7-1005(-)
MRTKGLEHEKKNELTEAIAYYSAAVDKILEGNEGDHSDPNLAAPLLDYGRALLLLSQKTIDLMGGLNLEKTLSNNLSAVAEAAEKKEDNILSKGKGKIFIESDEESENEEEEAAPVNGETAANYLQEAWEILDSARTIVLNQEEVSTENKDLLAKIYFFSGQVAMESDAMEQAVAEYQSSIEQLIEIGKGKGRFASEIFTYCGIACEYLGKKEEAVSNFQAAHDIMADILSGLKREDDPTGYDEDKSVLTDLAFKIQEVDAPKVSVKSEMDEFGSGFTKPLPSNSPIKDLGVFGKGTRGVPRSPASKVSSPAKRRIEPTPEEDPEGIKRSKS